jgi:hypothetical protein
MEKIVKYMWGLFLFTFPFSIRFVVYEQASYRFGNFNPWVTGFVYLPEILLLVTFLLWFINKIRIRDSGFGIQSGWLWVILFVFAVNLFVITLLKGDALLGAMFILRLFEGLVIFWLITDKVLEVKQVVTILLFGALLQIIWGYAQWRTNGSLGLQLLGESFIGQDVLGVAKIDLAEGAKQVRAYGSFLHPNIFAAYLLTVFFLALRYLRYSSKLFWMAIFITGIYLTHSQAAMLVGVVCLALYFVFAAFRAINFRKSVALIIVLLLVLGNFWFFKKSHAVNVRDASVSERLAQNVISKNMWKENPWGVGVSNYTLEMEKYSNCGSNSGSNSGVDCGARKYLPWEFQPVHNTYFLILNEVGIQGLILLLLFLLALFDLYWKAGKAVPVLVFMLLASFDHFLWDSWVGLMLIALVAGFFVLENHKEGIVERIEHAVHLDE